MRFIILLSLCLLLVQSLKLTQMNLLDEYELDGKKEMKMVTLSDVQKATVVEWAGTLKDAADPEMTKKAAVKSFKKWAKKVKGLKKDEFSLMKKYVSQ